MKHYPCFLLTIILAFLITSCGSAVTNPTKEPTKTMASLTATPTSQGSTGIITPNSVFGSNEDLACRQTIQSLYTIDAYCPNDLKGLESLYTKSFIQKYPPSLDRCTSIQKYKITKLLFQTDPGFQQPLDTPEPGTYRYYAEILFIYKSDTNTPAAASPTWIQVRMEDNQCKIDDVNGGG